MLWSEIASFFTDLGYDVIRPRHSEVDIADYSVVYDYLTQQQPTIVINAAGKTGTPNIDRCETHKEETMITNVNGAVNVVCVSKLLGIYNVYIGSGCIYQGNNDGKWFSEIDTPNYVGSFYSWTKVKAQELLEPFDVLQLRIRMPILSKPNPRNFIDKIAKYSHVINEWNSVTVVDDMLVAMKVLIEQKVTGIMNMVNPGVLYHHDMLVLYKKIVDPNHSFTPISMEELVQKFTCAGRSNCTLSSENLEKYILLDPIDKRIKEIMNIYKANIR
jgi:dTDP-4-dehydrorhamnose reductase